MAGLMADQPADGLEVVGRQYRSERLVDRLESKKLVERVPCPKDRRRVFCRITPEGLALLKELDAPVNQADARAVSVLREDELGSLIEQLDRVRAAHS